jgi:hypothetical protein
MVNQVLTAGLNHQSLFRPRTTLLRRPVLHDDEWFMSFVLRAAQQNGCTVSTGHYLRQVESCIRQSMPADRIQRHSVDGTNKQGHSHFGSLRIPDWAVRTSGGACPSVLPALPSISMSRCFGDWAAIESVQGMPVACSKDARHARAS